MKTWPRNGSLDRRSLPAGLHNVSYQNECGWVREDQAPTGPGHFRAELAGFFAEIGKDLFERADEVVLIHFALPESKRQAVAPVR
jgi:hypothetical protein